MDRFDPTCPQPRLHLGSTSANKAPTLTPTSAHGSKMAQFGPKLDLFGSNFTPSLGPHGLKMGHMAGPIRDCQNTGFQLYFQPFGMDHALCWAMFPMLCLRQAQLGTKLSPKCSKLRHAGPGLDPVHHMAPPNFFPTWQIGANLGSSSWVQDGCTQVGPLSSPDSLWHAENLRLYRCVKRFLALVGGLVQDHIAHIGPVLGPTSAPDEPPHTGPSCAC